VICGGNERRTLRPLIDGVRQELDRAGVSDLVKVALADAGFWNTEQIQNSPTAGSSAPSVDLRGRLFTG